MKFALIAVLALGTGFVHSNAAFANDPELSEGGCALIMMTGALTLDALANGSALVGLLEEAPTEVQAEFEVAEDAFDSVAVLTNPSANLFNLIVAFEEFSNSRIAGSERDAIINYAVSGRFDDAILSSMVTTGMRNCFINEQALATETCMRRLSSFASANVPECASVFAQS